MTVIHTIKLATTGGGKQRTKIVARSLRHYAKMIPGTYRKV